MHESKAALGLSVTFIIFLVALSSVGADISPVTTGLSFDRDGDRIDDRFAGILLPAEGFVHLDEARSADDVARDLSSFGIEVIGIYHLVPIIRVNINDHASLGSIASIEGVRSIEAMPEIVPLMDTSVKGIKAATSSEYSPDTAQDMGYTGKGVAIAFIDSGVDNEHPTFEGAFVAGADFTRPETPLTPRDGTFDPDDDAGHGTAVASIALGRGDADGLNIGVAPGAGLIDLKIMGYPNNPLSSAGANMVEAMQWSVDHQDQQWNTTIYVGVDIISISLGIGPIDGAVALAIQSTVESGIPVVLAAGNTGGDYSSQSQTSWPDGAIIVSGIDDRGTVTRDDDEAWSGSTVGPRTDDGDMDQYDELKPDVSAPSAAITTAQFSRFSNVQPASSWTEGSGTSFAAPHVSGTLALLLELSMDLEPSGSTNPLKRCLHLGSEERGVPFDEDLSESYDVAYGWGYLDAFGALVAARGYTGANSAPVLRRIEAVPDPVPRGSECEVRIVAFDADEEPLEYSLKADAGSIDGEGPVFTWYAPDTAGNFTLSAKVTDPSGGSDASELKIEVLQEAKNVPPLISSLRASPEIVTIGGTSTITTVARDQDGDALSYEYSATIGSIVGSGEIVTFVAPGEPGDARIEVTVADGRGGEANREVVVSVREDVVNAIPVIILVEITPSSISDTQSGLQMVVRAQVDDPDGLQDIASVICDMSDIGMSASYPMRDNGTDGDLSMGDGIYSVMVDDVGPLEAGNRSIVVTASDIKGASTVGRGYIRVSGSGTGNIEVGDSGMDPLMIVFMIIVVSVVLLSGILIWVGMSRNRARKRTSLGPVPQGAGLPPATPVGTTDR